MDRATTHSMPPSRAIRGVNPATGETLSEYPFLGEQELNGKLAKAESGFAHWRQTPVGDRAKALAAIAVLFAAERERLACLAVSEMGKTYLAALGEVDKCAYTLRHYATKGPALLADSKVEMPGAEAFLRFLPIGPILAVMPWNFPFFQVVRFLAPTLLGGNVGLLKHAENVPQCALALEDIIRRAGLPEGVFQTLFIDIPTVGKVIADPRVAAVTVTGSERAGRSVAEHAGRALKKCVLELGGSDPLIVMPSADIEAAAKSAVKARIFNNGQSCICAKRFIVHTAVYEPFLAAATEALETLRVGEPMAADTDIGPLVSHRAREILRGQTAKAIAAGGRQIGTADPVAGPGFYYRPALIVDVPTGAPMRQEEMFGPVAMIFRASDEDDAVAIANETPFGLGSSVWTRNAVEAAYFTNRLDAGMTFVNMAVASDPHIPFGGVKSSGFGREFGTAGLHEFLNIKTVVRS